MHTRTLLSTLLGATLLTSTAFAQSYPDRAVTMVVPFSAGGPTDTVARLIAERMSAELGQQVLIENVGGAGGSLGARQVSVADADGYTILLHHIGMATSETLYRNLAYETLEAFDYIGLVTEVPMVVVARKDFPAADFTEFMQYVKDNAETINMANAGIGAASHLCGMLFTSAIETPLMAIPYQGTGPAMTDLLGGQVDFMCDQTTNTASQIKGETVKAYAVTSTARLDAFPNIPTAAEAGLPGLEVGIWHGIYAPKGSPSEAIDRLSAALQAALADPGIATAFAELGTVPSPVEEGTPEALKAKLESEVAKWQPIIEAAGVYAD